ncbi:hypothetical protein F383_25652 [Gossypium arboreum]|uniref:Uncharacterized protein n=1 Tax=Gossypium arboreum TaxID=29729 RepID=A0A0B0MSU6_GOSAR|nr:hypothetical protein F383_25652 [Gossypium arboreum]
MHIYMFTTNSTKMSQVTWQNTTSSP